MAKLAGKVALVTGGSRGIGAAIARRLAEDGAKVAITYVSAAGAAEEVVRQIESAGGKALAINADAADVQASIDAVERTVGEFGRIDVLVNNAGVFDGGPLEALTPEQFDRSFNVNVRGPLFATQAAARHMAAGSSVITIGSCLAVRVPSQTMTIYSASKAALLGLTKGLARDLGPQGITVNLVQPGPIDTDMNPATGPGADDQRKLLVTGKYGKPEDIAAMVSLLASEEGRNITGTAIDVDGGANV